MDREPTPLKQRQKRSAGSNNRNRSDTASPANHGGAPVPQPGTAASPARAFRSSSTTSNSGTPQRGRPKAGSMSGAQPPPSPSTPVALAKPPRTILRASSSNSLTNAALAPPISSPGTLYNPGDVRSPPPRVPTQQQQQQQQQQLYQHQRNSSSSLRVNTSPSGAPQLYSYSSPSPSPSAATAMKKQASSSSHHQQQPHHHPSQSPPTSSSSSATTPSSVLLRPPSTATLSPFVSPPPTSTKLIGANFQFASDIPTRLASCLELSNFTVIGTLGFEATGKSTLLSLLAKTFSSSVSVSGAAFRSHHLDKEQQPGGGAPFTVRQKTQGVDLYVACEAPKQRGNAGGLVLLDTQPLLSASHLADVLSRNDPSSSSSSSSAGAPLSSAGSSSSSSRFSSASGALSAEQQVELASTQLAILMLSICHYVVVPAVDLEMVLFLRKVAHKMQQCRLPNISGHVVAKGQQKHCAQLLLVGGAQGGLEQLLPSEWRFQPPATAMAAPPPVNWSRLTLDESGSSQPHVVADWRYQAKRWTRFVESLPASPSFTKPPTTAATTTTAATASPPPLTLKEWLSNTARVWESVKRSNALTEPHPTRDQY